MNASVSSIRPSRNQIGLMSIPSRYPAYRSPSRSTTFEVTHLNRRSSGRAATDHHTPHVRASSDIQLPLIRAKCHQGGRKGLVVMRPTSPKGRPVLDPCVASQTELAAWAKEPCDSPTQFDELPNDDRRLREHSKQGGGQHRRRSRGGIARTIRLWQKRVAMAAHGCWSKKRAKRQLKIALSL